MNTETIQPEVLLNHHPLIVWDIRDLYPTLPVNDLDLVENALKHSRELFGEETVKRLLKEYPDVFLFSSLCSWAYMAIINKNINSKEQQLITFINTMMGVGYGVEVCTQVVNTLDTSEKLQNILMHVIYSAAIDQRVLYSYCAEAQGCTVH